MWPLLTARVLWRHQWSSVTAQCSTEAVHVNAVRRASTDHGSMDLTWAPVCRASATTELQPATHIPATAAYVTDTRTHTLPTCLSADIRLVSEHGRRHLRRSSSYRTLAVHVPLSATEASACVEQFIGYYKTDCGQFRQPLKTHLFRA